MSFLISEAAAPSTPASNKVAIYAKSDGRVYGKDDAGTEFNMSGLSSGTAVSASGTSVDFTGLPSGVKKIIVMLSGISTNGSSIPILQLGDSGGIETSGYSGGAGYAANAASSSVSAQTIGFGLSGAISAATSIYGNAIITKIDGNSWVMSVSGYLAGGTAACISGGGSKSLSDVLTQIRLTTVNGTDAFDGGTVNILYE